MEKEGVTMVINFEELHPNVRAELERNIFYYTLEPVSDTYLTLPMNYYVDISGAADALTQQPGL